jgi:hypothetical protein
MITTDMLAALDTRLRSIKDANADFGGMSVVMFGKCIALGAPADFGGMSVVMFGRCIALGAP